MKKRRGNPMYQLSPYRFGTVNDSVKKNMTGRLFFFAYRTSSGCTYVRGLYHNFFFLRNSGNLAPSTSSSNNLRVIGSQDGISLCLLVVEVVRSQLCLNIKYLFITITLTNSFLHRGMCGHKNYTDLHCKPNTG